MTLFLEEANTQATTVLDWSEEPSEPGGAGDAGRPHFPPRPLTAMVVGLLAVVGAGSALVGAAGWADVHPFPFIAAGVAVLIAGLVARTYRGGGRAMLPLGSLMLCAVAVTAIASPHLDDGTGDRVYRPASFDDLAEEYSFGIGDATFDLREVAFPAGVHVVEVDMGIGHAVVWVPADVDVEIVGDLEIGKIDVLDDTADGFGNRLVALDTAGNEARLVLDVEMDIGYLEVRRG